MGEAKRKVAARVQMIEVLRQAHAEGQGVWSIEALSVQADVGDLPIEEQIAVLEPRR